ncbi:MAG TPA: enoyl-CoA hydratase/isomerase family protein [Xanthobacteraceae bacterium]|nr:enoyl-CoA hydratase/isomerase family protein [Xanthobacteraceae bacterium]
MDEPHFFEFHVADGVGWIDLARPEQGNTLTRERMVALAALIRDCAGREDVSVIALTARGDAFCRGRDGRGESRDGMSAWQIREQHMGAVLGVYEAISAAPLPVIACVQGAAFGFGAALAGACDITLASSAARFALPEIEHGIPATMAMAALLRKVPHKALTYLIYSADEIDAAAAGRLGLASVVYEADAFETLSRAFILKLAARPRLTLETIKRYLVKAPDLSAAMASDYAGHLLALVRSGR